MAGATARNAAVHGVGIGTASHMAATRKILIRDIARPHELSARS
jgi:hypothetical protein